MTEYDCTTSWPRHAVTEFLSSVPAIFTLDYAGEYPDLARAAMDGAMYSILGNVEKDFRKKSLRSPGVDGDVWKGLSASRKHQRLSKTRDKYIAKLGERLGNIREARGDLGYAEGGQLPILIDEGDLIRSMSQGQISGQGRETRYQATDKQNVEYTSQNSIEMRSDVLYADAHQYGQGKIPQRRLVPDTTPDAWIQEATAVATQIICEFIVEILEGEYEPY